MRFIAKMFMVVCLCGIVYGQRDGIPTFSAADVHEFDTVNLFTLAPTFNFPVFSKPGAIPLSVSITSPQNCYVYTGGANPYWTCGNENFLTAPFFMTPNVTGLAVQYTTTIQGGCTYYHLTGLVGPDGVTTYPFAGPPYTQIGYGTNCGATSASLVTINGEYYYATISSAGGSPTLVSATSAGGLSATNLTVTDTFGNSVSNHGTFITDTLGTNTLSFSGQYNVPTSYTYTDSNGSPQSITLTTGAQTTFHPLPGLDACGADSTSYPSVTPITAINYPDGTSFGIGWQPNGGGISGLINSITLRTGGTISYTYGALFSPCGISFTSLSRTTSDGTTNYSMQSTSGHAPYITTVLDPGNNKTVYTFAAPLILEIARYQNTGTVASPVYTLLTTDMYCYNGNQTNCASAIPAYPITQRDVYHYVGATSLEMSHSTQVFDSYGNATSSSAHDYISGTTLTTTTTYGSSCGPNSNIKNHPCDVLTTDGAHNLSETKYTYNSNGAALSSSRWVSGSTWLTTNYTPNGNGTVASTTAANGQVTTYGYSWVNQHGQDSCNSLLLASASTTINGVVLSSSQSWDCNTGLVLTTTDANGNTPPATQYDSMLRPVIVADNTGYSVSTSYASNSVTSTPSFGTPSIAYVDSLGRPAIGQTQQSPASSYYDTISSSYAFSGPNRQASASSPCTQTSDNPCGSNFSASTINPIGLPISSTDPLGGTLTYTYSKNDASVTVGPAPSGEHVKTIQTEVDGLGRTKSVCTLQTSGGTACGQAMGGSGVLDTYSYSFGVGTATTSVTRGTQTHTTTVDALGRPISVTTPEAGTVTYTYDTSSTFCNHGGGNSSPGALMEIINNSGSHICFVRYPDGRVATTYNPDSSGVWHNCRNFTYGEYLGPNQGIPTPTGAAINSIGRIADANIDYNCNGNWTPDEWFSYDADGRITDMWESTPHSGGYYHTSVGYNPDSSVNAINGIPGYPGYTFGVDGEGRPYTASDAVSIVSGVSYDAASRPLSVSVGTHGDSDTFVYDATEKMTNYTFTANGISDAGTLTWNSNSTVKKLAIVDGFNAGGSQTCNFSYDDVARLITDNCGSSLWNQTYSYDQYDNLTKTGNPGTTWNSGYNSINEMLGSSYDADGHLLYDGVNTYSWDAYGKLSGVRAGTTPAVCGTSGFCPTYDAAGRVVESSTAGTYKEYLYSPIGRLAQMSGQGTSEADIPLPGGLTLKATGTGGTNRFVLHNDWLGTNRLATNLGSRTWLWDTAYTPYGETYDTFGTPKQDFTGDFQDIFAGLFDTPNRELATNASRWLSPDPAGASWNAYAYSTDPNTHTDPTGLDDKDQNGITPTDFCKGYSVCLTGDDEPWMRGGKITELPPAKAPGPTEGEHWYDVFGSMIHQAYSSEGRANARAMSSVGSGYIQNGINAVRNFLGDLTDTRDEDNIGADALLISSGLGWENAGVEVVENPLFETTPGRNGWEFNPADQLGRRLDSQFNRATGWMSEIKEGGAFENVNRSTMPLRLSSMYEEGLEGMWRTSDHTMMDVRGIMTPEQIREFGGTMLTDKYGVAYTFEKPITLFIRWENYLK